MNPYISVFDIFEHNKILKEKITSLENEITKLKADNANLKETLDSRNKENACEILQYFHSCSSIRKTAWKYCIKMEELYELIPEWDGCRDGLQSADDYVECRIEVIGRREYDEELEEDLTWEEREFRERALDEEDINNIIADYTESNLSLYELADRYELKINYLFRVLKENKVLEKETDAKGYASFYEEHMGSTCEWDGTSDLGLIY
jgi:hypothetical protein